MSCITLYWLQGVEFWAVNTDAQALENSLAMNKVQLGSELTRGLGNDQWCLTTLALLTVSAFLCVQAFANACSAILPL